MGRCAPTRPRRATRQGGTGTGRPDGRWSRGRCRRTCSPTGARQAQARSSLAATINGTIIFLFISSNSP